MAALFPDTEPAGVPREVRRKMGRSTVIERQAEHLLTGEKSGDSAPVPILLRLPVITTFAEVVITRPPL